MKQPSSFKIGKILVQSIDEAPNSGDIIIYKYNGNLQIGRFFRADDLIYIMPINAPYEAKIISETQILTKVKVL